ncbi:Kinesin-like protein NACK1 [Acorus calamus]|uniref:Kinesin-like protein NACK1 n=1 Tax=Acorus calamus TaxID=4465 RepID=A0AAV9FJA9_ACOCL|nr:Kinesin-like protein NACK1 [Acorus calamus]
MEPEIENRAPNGDIQSRETLPSSEKATPTKSEDGGDVSSREGTPYWRSSSVNMRKMQKMFQNEAEENISSIRAYVTELKEQAAKLHYQKQLLVCQVLELEANEATGHDTMDSEGDISELQKSPATWKSVFVEQRQ